MKELVVNLLSEVVPDLSKEEISDLLEIPPKQEMGDYAFPCFSFAKKLHKAPNLIAQSFAEKISAVPEIDHIECKGAYLNFYFNRDLYISKVLEQAADDNYGSSDEGRGKTICIDYSSPNVAKNFHVGHLRTTVIGNSLYKIFSKRGYHVERINHLGDWGTQFGKLIVAYKKWGSEELVKKYGIKELMDLYVKFHKEADKDDSLNDEARAWFHKMELGDEEALSIWKWFVDISLVEFKRVYKLLGMEFDHYTGESFYRNMTDDVVKMLRDKNLLTESQGAEIVDLSAYDMAPCLIVKKDGSSIYATRDIAAVFYRKKTYHFCKCIYVTGQEQKLHFRQVFKVIELLGNDWAKTELIHIPYGLVSLAGEKLSSRDGNVIFAEDILNEAISKIKDVISEKNPDLKDKDDVARIVGVGAVIFNNLYNQRIKDVSFRWENLLNFDGETGPYVQYTYARCSSVLRKITDYSDDIPVDSSLLSDEASFALVKQFSIYPDIIKQAEDQYEPSVIARYAVDTAQAFNKFYTENRINDEDENLRMARCRLVSVTRKILKDSLSLLGIGTVEEM